MMGEASSHRETEWKRCRAAARRPNQKGKPEHMSHIGKPLPRHCIPLTNATILEYYDYLFAPWVKELGLREFHVEPGIVTALLPQNRALKFSSGAICGQAIMAAIDTVASLAMTTRERVPKGTVYQHTHFLRPAVNDDFRVRAEVLRFGKASSFAEVRVSFALSGILAAQASIEFAF
jgi:acyl-coenzyme A thioesterase PaaI-like protein